MARSERDRGPSADPTGEARAGAPWSRAHARGCGAGRADKRSLEQGAGGQALEGQGRSGREGAGGSARAGRG